MNLSLRHLTRIHPECLPDMPIEVLEVTTIHESMIVGVDSFLPTCGDGFLEELIDHFS